MYCILIALYSFGGILNRNRKNDPRPTIANELRLFLAFAGYYRKFVKEKLQNPFQICCPQQVKVGKNQ